ncbi:MAG: ribose-phosphate diphosphokinase [Planctomycetota bacterium]
MYDRLMLFTGRVSYYLSQKIVRTLRKFPGFQGAELYEPDVIRFANENLKVKITESVRGADVYVIQTAASSWHAPMGVNPDKIDSEEASELCLSENLMELLVMIDALHGASAGRITVVTPYYPYARSDKKDEPRISITARLMAQLFEEAGADRILTVNLHALQIQGFAPMPCDQLDANPLIADYFRRTHDLSNFGVLATDAGGVKWATKYAEMLHSPLAVCDKRRWEDNEGPEIRNVIGISEIRDRKIAIFDDEILTGGTICTAIDVLEERFDLPVSYISCVHPVFAPGAIEKIKETGVEQIVTSDTLPPPNDDDGVEVVSAAPLIAAAIRNIHTNESVTQIFKQPSFLLGGEQSDLW